MATILLTTAKFFANANPYMKALMMLGASYIDSKLFAPKMPDGPRLDSLALQTSTYGTPVNSVYGTARIGGNIIWGTNFVEHKHKSGGKGGGGGSTTYSYTVSCAIGICKGPILGITRVWADGTEVTNKFKNIVATEDELRQHTIDDRVKSGAIKNNSVQYKLYVGDEKQEPDPWIEGIEGDGTSPAYRGLAYIVLKDLEIADFGNRVPNFTFEVVAPTKNLALIVQDISNNARLYETFGDLSIDVSDLARISVHGFPITGDMSYRDRIDALRSVYQFDCLEEEGTIVFRRKASREIFSVDYDNLGAAEESDSTKELYQVVRKHELELPKTVTLTYTSLDKDYNQGSMSANRVVTRSTGETSYTLTPILTDAEAKTLAETKLYELWAERNSVSFRLGLWWAFLAPGTLLLLNTGARKRLLQVTKTSFGQPGLMQVESSETVSASLIFGSRTADAEILPSEPKTPGPYVFHIMDLPRLPTDTSGNYGEYIAGGSNLYYGTTLYKTVDGGESYSLVQQLDARGTIGTTTNALPIGPTEVWDYKNVLTVELICGELESRTEAAVLNGYNAALVGNEIIQFQTAILVAPQVYELSGLLRGKLGTEDGLETHIAGERFVLLASDEIGFLIETADDWDEPRNYKYGPQTLEILDPSYIDLTHTSTGRIAQCWSPCHLAATRDDEGNATITWVRRARDNYEWLDKKDVPLGESYEQYEVDIYDEDGSVVQTFVSSTPSLEYSVDAQLSGLGAVKAAIHIKVYQVNDKRGRGIGREAIV